MAKASEPARSEPREVVWVDKDGRPVTWVNAEGTPMTWVALEDRMVRRAARQIAAKARATKPFLD